MGEAKRRGTFEERKALAIKRTPKKRMSEAAGQLWSTAVIYIKKMKKK